MSSVTEQAVARKPVSHRFVDAFEIWNRKLHYYLGLYFLFFLWLFSLTGLLLNHASWKFQEFWPNRKITISERPIQPPPQGGDFEQARDLMRQLAIRGEIEWTSARSDPARFDFRVARPGRTSEIKADLKRGLATVERTEINLWGLMRVLHTFTGVRMTDSRNQRDWTLTTAWALSMDALALGLILTVFSSFYMWWGLQQKRRLGIVALGLGTVICGFMVFGLQWIYS